MEQNLIIFMILMLTLTGSVSATETAYQWTDDQGQIQYGDRRPVSVESRPIILQQDTILTDSRTGLRPGEHDRLSQINQRQRQQQHNARATKTRADRQRTARRSRCADNREMLKNSRGRDTFKKHSRYLRNNCW